MNDEKEKNENKGRFAQILERLAGQIGVYTIRLICFVLGVSMMLTAAGVSVLPNADNIRGFFLFGITSIVLISAAWDIATLGGDKIGDFINKRLNRENPGDVSPVISGLVARLIEYAARLICFVFGSSLALVAAKVPGLTPEIEGYFSTGLTIVVLASAAWDIATLGGDKLGDLINKITRRKPQETTQENN